MIGPTAFVLRWSEKLSKELIGLSKHSSFLEAEVEILQLSSSLNHQHMREIIRDAT